MSVCSDVIASNNPHSASFLLTLLFLYSHLRKDWRTCKPARRPVALRLALFFLFCFFKLALSLCCYHRLLETLAFRLFENSVPFLMPPIISDHPLHYF